MEQGYGMTTESMTNTTFHPDNSDYDDDDVSPCEAPTFGHIISTCFLLIFFISVTGNGLLLCVLTPEVSRTRLKDPKNVINLFVLNLAISDLLFTVTLPFWAVYVFNHWVFGDAACKLVVWAYFVGLYSSVILLTVMAVDRFAAVVMKKWQFNPRRRKCAWVTCGGSWVISVAASLIDALSSGVEGGHGYFSCAWLTDNPVGIGEDTGYYLQITLLFLLPLVIIVFCYCCIIRTALKTKIKQKKRSIVVVLCILMAFFLCWAPYYIMIFLNAPVYKEGKECTVKNRLQIAFEICQILAFSHCCMNPILYMLSEKFRKRLFNLFHCFTVQGQVKEGGRNIDQSTSNVIQKAYVMHHVAGRNSNVTLDLEITQA